MRMKHKFANLQNSFIYDPKGFLVWKTGNYVGRKVGWVQSKPKPYWVCQFGNRKCYVHRLIFQFHHGFCPKVIDHVDGNGLNNRIENLRESCPSKNMFNIGRSKDNKSGQKGVYFCNTNKKWVAQIQAFNKRKTLGSFENKTQAIQAYNKAAKIIHKEFFNKGGAPST